MAGKLVICPTPIGNLGDMPPRAAQALRDADAVLAEDTRVTGKLLSALGISARLERLDENLMAARAVAVVERVRAGELIAYCTDAGMPGVSDPGLRLVDAALDAGVPVEVLPGPTAVATAYVASGFSCPRFYFGGFFPRKQGERERALAGVAGLDAVCLFYESPHRIGAALAAVAAALPGRGVAVCRELTKLHEEVVRGPAAQVAAEFARREAEGGVKGEIVLVIDAPGQAEAEAAGRAATAQAAERAAELLAAGELSRKDIARALRQEFGISRNEAYELVHGREQASGQEHGSGRAQAQRRERGSGQEQASGRAQARGQEHGSGRDQTSGRNQAPDRGQAPGRGQAHGQDQAHGQEQASDQEQARGRGRGGGREQASGKKQGRGRDQAHAR